MTDLVGPRFSNYGPVRSCTPHKLTANGFKRSAAACGDLCLLQNERAAPPDGGREYSGLTCGTLRHNLVLTDTEASQFFNTILFYLLALGSCRECLYVTYTGAVSVGYSSAVSSSVGVCSVAHKLTLANVYRGQ